MKSLVESILDVDFSDKSTAKIEQALLYNAYARYIKDANTLRPQKWSPGKFYKMILTEMAKEDFSLLKIGGYSVPSPRDIKASIRRIESISLERFDPYYDYDHCGVGKLFLASYDVYLGVLKPLFGSNTKSEADASFETLKNKLQSKL